MQKKHIIIGSLLVIGAIALGSSLAWWTWSTSSNEQTNVVVTVGGITIDYEDGENITNNNLIPTSTKEKGISKDITVSSTGQVYLDLNMAVVTLDVGLKDASFKYEIYNGSDLVTGGNFANSNAGDNIALLSGVEVTSSPTTYTLYIWIDGNMSNPNTMYNQNFEFRLNAEATDEVPKEYATDTITKLLASNPETMNNDDPDNNIRYMGADPNNYVSFNNELWRIIGVFDVASTDGGSTEKRIKIIRDESLGKMAWDSNDYNNWTTASLNTYLNETYYNTIDPTSQSLIGDTYWNLGGTANYTSASNGLASHWYGYERGTTVYGSNPIFWVGKIGLMYPSDYGYATSGGTTTNRASCLAKEMFSWGSSSYSDCKNNDYLYNSSSSQWTISPGSSYSFNVFSVVISGYVYYSNAGYSNNSASPVLYLNSNVTITGGDGSSGNPYTLSVE